MPGMSASGIRSRARRAVVRLVAVAVAVGAAAAVAVLAAGAAAPASAASLTAGSWYGYAVTGSTYTSTTADWTVPTLNCATAGKDPYISIWTGLDGYSSDSVEQIGVDAMCDGSTASYEGWYEVYPAVAVYFSNPISPGDQLDASVTFSGTDTFTLKLQDVTQGWTETAKKTLSGAERSSAETIVQVPNTYTCSSAQTPAKFTGDTVDGTALGSLSPVKVTGSDPHIAVSAVSGKSFTVSCAP
jgi:Peptidase A4 family